MSIARPNLVLQTNCNTDALQPERTTEPLSVLQGRIGGINSGIARRLYKAKLQLYEANLPLPQAPSTVIQSAPPTPVIQPQVIETLVLQITQIDALLKETTDAKAVFYLVNAKDKLFQQWAWLSGIPKPMDRPQRNQPIRQRSIAPIQVP